MARALEAAVEIVSGATEHAAAVVSNDNGAVTAPLVAQRRVLRNPAQSALKRMLDIAASLVAIAFFSPLLATLYVLVRLDGGPALFVQQRVGRDGKMFPCYKFRSMVPDAETRLKDLLVCNEQFRKDWETERKLRNDPRITRLGAFLRRRSLDELPQFFNVLRGDMSLVGPRPITPDECDKYGDDLKFYMLSRPGLTGSWQVSGRNDLTYARRVELDVEYMSTWSTAKDIAILFRTVGVVLDGRGAL